MESLNTLIDNKSIVINDLISGKVYTSDDIKHVKLNGSVVELGICDKEIQLVIDDEILGCFTKKELETIRSDLEMEFPFAVISIIEGQEHTIITRGLTSWELDLVTYNIRKVFEETISRLND